MNLTDWDLFASINTCWRVNSFFALIASNL